MKTFYVEQRMKSAKLFHRNNQQQTHYEKGILIHHLYPDRNENTLSWWDDVGFILNDYRVSIAWTHPRQAFLDHVQNLAFDMVSEACSKNELNSVGMSEEQTPIHKKVGRSRKTIKFYKQNFLPDNGFIKALRKTESELAASTDFVVVPKLHIYWTKRSRFVSACLPMEVRDDDDLMVLASTVKRLIKREVTLNELYPDFRYTKQNWADEKTERGDNEFHIHAIA